MLRQISSHVSLFALCVSIVSAPAFAQVWERPVAPGITFRMERQANPQRNIYGLRIDPRLVKSESSLAGKTVYELGPANGTGRISAVVKEHDALGGINGDFFQWGKDPGGDPLGLMVRGGELLSQPGDGDRATAAAWGPNGNFAVGTATWEASVSLNGGPRQVLHGLNARADGGQLSLHTDSAGYAYTSAAGTAARVHVGAYKLGPDSKLKGTITEIVPLAGRVRIAPGELLLTGAGKAQSRVQALKVGDTVEAEIKVKGFDWGKMDQVMGGGPILLHDGKSVLPPEAGEFSTTRHPRSAMGRTSDGSIWYIVIDGRQTMSVGASLTETAEILQKWNCVDAINLDGGGSTTLNLMGVTLNRVSGGVERAVANGILFYGTPPATNAQKVTFKAPAALQVGTPVRIEALSNGVSVPATKTLFTAMGAGWIDQDGMLYPVKEGVVEIAALVDGTVARTTLTVVPGATPATPAAAPAPVAHR